MVYKARCAPVAPDGVPEGKILIGKNNMYYHYYYMLAYTVRRRRRQRHDKRCICRRKIYTINGRNTASMVPYMRRKKNLHTGRENSATAHTRQRWSCSIFFLIKNAENARNGNSVGIGKNHDRVNGAFV